MTKIIHLEDLKEAYQGSYYTILGAGGDLQEWVDGMEEILAERGIGAPVAWYFTTGKEVNEYMGPVEPNDQFQDDLVILLFPFTGMNVGKLAILKVQMGARWFDDIVDNARRRGGDG